MYTPGLSIALLASIVMAAPKPCPRRYHFAFSTNTNTSAPIFHAAELLQSLNTTAVYIIAGPTILPTSLPIISAGAIATFNGTGSKQCLSLSSPTIHDAGISIGIPRIDPSGPAYSYPVSATPGFAGDCRWYLGTTDPAQVSVFPGIYEANEGLYSCKTLIGDVVYNVLSLGKTGGGLESPRGCVYSVATAFRGR